MKYRASAIRRHDGLGDDPAWTDVARRRLFWSISGGKVGALALRESAGCVAGDPYPRRETGGMVGGLRRALEDYRERILGRPRLAIVMGAVLIVVEGAFLWRLGVHAQLAPYLCFGLVGVVLAEFDLSARRIPNRIVLPSIVLELALFAVASDVDRHWYLLARSVIAAALFATFLFVLGLAYRHRGGVGGGDVKVAALIGLVLGWLGWTFVFTGVLLAFLLQLGAGQILRMSHRLQRGEAVPMGPFLFAGAVLAILLP